MAETAHDRVVYLADDCGREGVENKRKSNIHATVRSSV
jgi:hypothetical protein